MIVSAVRLTLYAPFVHSLKQKRMVVRSLTAKVRNRFNVSVAEVDAQDVHQTIVLGMACVAGTVRLADSITDSIIDFIHSSTEAEIIRVERELR